MLDRMSHTHMHDAKPSRADPTGTGALRGKLRNDLDRRWAKLRRVTAEAINGSLFHPTVTGIAHAAQQIVPINKVQVFQKWFDEALRQIVLEGDGEWIAGYVDTAGEQARARVSVLVGDQAELDHSDMQHLGSQMEAELQGIVEATSQQSVRAFSNCLLARTRPAVIARQINSCILAVGQKRGLLLADHAVTKSYAIASLSAMRSLGISKVGTIPERKVKIKQTKHGKTFAKDARDLPDVVEVLTAGDNDVCLVCEDISDNGPYDIDEAVDLIPAHPRCRCAFIPADDARYADVRDFDPDQPRDYHGRWTGEAGTNGGRTGTVSLGEAQRAATKAASGAVPLQGLPQAPIKFKDGSYYVPGPIGMLRDAASNYMRSTGLKYDPPQTFQKVDVERATRIAQSFDAMAHDPTDPQVKASYDAMAKETIGQYHALKDMGISFEFIPHGKDPYAESPRLAAQDVIQNKHLWVFPTSSGFGSGDVASAEAIKNNPLLAPTNEYIGDHRLVVNDVFRIVHDMFGHFKEGNGFRADGEENAWRSHAAMYSDLARGAMTSETRGQNSWVNYGPHGEANRTASAAATVFAPQKIGLLPDWVMREGRFDKNKLHDEYQARWRAVADWFESLDYDPDQPRDPHGRWSSENVAKWAAEDEKFQTEKLIDDGPREGTSRVGTVKDKNIFMWGANHAASSAITGYSAKLMGIDGYKETPLLDGAEKLGEKFLDVIANGRPSQEKLFHGFEDTKKIDWKIGDTVRLPLLATSGEFDYSAGYGTNYQKEDNSGATVMEFPAGTPMAGYDRWDRNNTKEFGYTWSEAIVAGGFKVTGIRQEHEPGWKQLPIKVVSLEQTEVFDPRSKKWIKH